MARRAILTIRRGTGHERRFDPIDFISVLLLAAAIGTLWLKPFTVFRCGVETEGQAQCTISERLLLVAPLRTEHLRHLTDAGYAEHTETSESTDSEGKHHTTETTVEDLSLSDAQGSTVWRTSESYLIGASLQNVGDRVQSLIRGASSAPFVRWHTAWPVLLIATLFGLIGAIHLMARLGGALVGWGVISPVLERLAFERAPGVFLLLLFASAWVVALLGGDPPATLIGVLGLTD